MKKYMEPELQVTSIQVEDILIASGDLLEWDGIYSESEEESGT